jgi:CRP-like cAMP-binding protein
MSTGLSLQHIDRLSARVVSKSVRRGANIFVKGDPGTSLFVIEAGKVKISVPSVERKNAIFNVLGKGDIFGEIALLDGLPRTADATAVTDCELNVIERQDFLPVMREEPEISLRFLEILCSRLRRTTEQAQDVMSLDPTEPSRQGPDTSSRRRPRRRVWAQDFDHPEGSWQHHRDVARKHQQTIAPMGR